jgi:hypothetical protein
LDFHFPKACKTFYFNNKNSKELLLFSEEELFKINYMDSSEKEVVYTLENPLSDQPNFGRFSKDQRKFIVTSAHDILYVNLDEKVAERREIDFDDKEEVGALQNILASETHFFVLANKKEGKLGYFLFKIDINDPHAESEYLINWCNKLDIGNCDLQLMKQPNDNGGINEFIVVSYKSIGINTFNVFIIDLQDKLIKYWHEGYQLWESPVKGFLLSTNDFMILSKDGLQLLQVGQAESKVVTDKDGQKRMIHSLGKCDYIKIEPGNHLLFAFQFYDDRQIKLQEQYNDLDGSTNFDDIFGIKIHEITLRELMLIQSIYACKT